jgi:hypothetical protein
LEQLHHHAGSRRKEKLNINFDKSLHIKCKADICINKASQNNTFVTKRYMKTIYDVRNTGKMTGQYTLKLKQTMTDVTVKPLSAACVQNMRTVHPCYLSCTQFI